MTRKEDLLDAVTRSFDGPAWHGPSLEDALADVTAEEAMYKPAHHVHSIWEIALHAAAWAEEVTSRLQGNPPGEPEAGDWALPGQLDNDGWEDAVQRVFAARDQLLAALRSQSDQDLDLVVGDDVTRYGTISGLVQHNAYHAGQIVYVKRLIRAVV